MKMYAKFQLIKVLVYFWMCCVESKFAWLFVLQVCAFQDQVSPHQILSRSSSEPSQPTFESTHTPDHIRTADQCHTKEIALEQDQTNTDQLEDYYTETHANDDAQTQSTVRAEVAHTQQKSDRRDTVIKDKAQVTVEQVHVENETNDHGLEGEESDKRKDTNMEPVEREENTNKIRWGMLHAYFTVVPSF